MSRLLVFTVDPAATTPDPQIMVVRANGNVTCYLYVDTIDRLAHYRHEEFPEDQARALIA